jgi:hypothetical protein
MKMEIKNLKNIQVTAGRFLLANLLPKNKILNFL